MEKNEWYKNFLEQYRHCDDEVREYSFDIIDNDDYYTGEYKTFISKYRWLFYSKNRLLTLVNSNNVFYNKEEIEHIIKIFKHFYENESFCEKITLGEFLIVYREGLKTNESKSDNEYGQSYVILEQLLKEYNVEELLNNMIPEISGAYFDIINYAINNDEFIDADIINKILNNIDVTRKNEMIELFLNNSINIKLVYLHDQNKKEHLNQYYDFIINVLKDRKLTEHVLDMTIELYNSKIMDEEQFKSILNIYVDKTNELIRVIKNEDENLIMLLGDIDELITDLNIFKKKIKLSKKYSDKIKDCLTKILNYKRKILGNKEYVDNSLQSISFKTMIPDEEVERFKEAVFRTDISFHNQSIFDLKKTVVDAIETYKDSLYFSLAKRYNINTEYETYIKPSEVIKSKKNCFVKYINSIADNYCKEKKIYTNNYYDVTLSYLENVFDFQQNFLLSVLGKEGFESKIDLITNNANYYMTKNHYAIMVANIIIIENNINQTLKKIGKKLSKELSKNLEMLFEYFCNEYNGDEYVKRYAINGLFYINYVLYEKRGLNLRNNAVHGNLINQNIDIPLLTTIVSIIIISSIRNEI